MLVGVVSDTHNRYANVEKALALLRQRGVELVLHCGDIEDEETVRLFLGMPAHFVFGNCDHDRSGLRRAMEVVRATLHEPFGELELAGRRIAFVHSDDKRLFRKLESEDRYDYLFYGHTHEAEEHVTGRTRVVNPGALHRARVKTCVVLDLDSGDLQSVVVDP